MTHTISLEIADSDLAHPDPELLQGWAEAALASERQPGDICLYIVGDAEMTELNSQYRGKAGPTNVLSFPADLPKDVPLALLGDIVLCSPLIGREARDQGKLPEAHWAHLVVHGTLHLLGYDHENTVDAEAMERREIEILADFGIANPYS